MTAQQSLKVTAVSAALVSVGKSFWIHLCCLPSIAGMILIALFPAAVVG